MDIHREIRKWANRKIRKVAKEHGLPTGVTFEWSHPTLSAENCGVAINSVQQPHAVKVEDSHISETETSA